MVMAEDVYNMDETSLFLLWPTKQVTKHKQKKFMETKFRRIVSLLVCCKHDKHNNLKHVIISKSLRPISFGRWLPIGYVWWFANQMA